MFVVAITARAFKPGWCVAMGEEDSDWTSSSGRDPLESSTPSTHSNISHASTCTSFSTLSQLELDGEVEMVPGVEMALTTLSQAIETGSSRCNSAMGEPISRRVPVSLRGLGGLPAEVTVKAPPAGGAALPAGCGI